MNEKRIELFCDTADKVEHYTQDQLGNTWVEIQDGATHIVAVAELQKLIEQTKNVFELTIKTIPYNDKDCLVTFNKIDKRTNSNDKSTA